MRTQHISGIAASDERVSELEGMLEEVESKLMDMRESREVLKRQHQEEIRKAVKKRWGGKES